MSGQTTKGTGLSAVGLLGGKWSGTLICRVLDLACVELTLVCFRHARAPTHTHTHTHTRTHARTPARTHARTHTHSPPHRLVFFMHKLCWELLSNFSNTSSRGDKYSSKQDLLTFLPPAFGVHVNCDSSEWKSLPSVFAASPDRFQKLLCRSGHQFTPSRLRPPPLPPPPPPPTHTHTSSKSMRLRLGRWVGGFCCGRGWPKTLTNFGQIYDFFSPLPNLALLPYFITPVSLPHRYKSEDQCS